MNPLHRRLIFSDPQVKHDGLFAAVVERKPRVRQFVAIAERLQNAALRITSGRFDLDDIGTSVSHRTPSGRSGDPHGQLNHTRMPANPPTSVTSTAPASDIVSPIPSAQ